MDMILAEARGESLPAPRTLTTDREAVEAAILGEGLGCECSALKDSLDENATYRQWQESVPRFTVVPTIRRWRNDFSTADGQLVNAELQAHGALLSRGQVLYRGCGPKERTLSPTVLPLSTTLHAPVARWHAVEVKGFVAVLRIQDHAVIRAYPFRTRGNQRLKHECEVLLEAGLAFTERSSEMIGGIEVVWADVYRTNAGAES